MNFWQFKVGSKDWHNKWEKEYDTLKVGQLYYQRIALNAQSKPRDNIGDIVFIYNTKKKSTKIYPKGIYLICKIIENLNSDNDIRLKVLYDLRSSPVEPADFGFEKIMNEIHSLSQNGTYYKFKEKTTPNEIYELLIKKDYIYPDEVDEKEVKKLKEGSKKRIIVNAYERNPIARETCLTYYGYDCSVCEFNFENIYGKIGKDFIHVHHLKALSEINEEYIINPIEDLRPVCPNCHAMLHKKKPAYTIKELKQIIIE